MKVTSLSLNRLQQPRFGFSAVNSAMQSLDFSNLGTSTVGQNKLIYGLVIGSRILASRSPNEAWENLRRDALGWYFWFLGSPLLQAGMATLLVPIISKGGKELLVRSMEKPTNPLIWVKNFLFAPDKMWRIATDEQLKQRRDQVMEYFRGRGMTQKAETWAKQFGKTIGHRGLMSLFGLLFTIGLLGIGMPYLNIFFTRNNLKKKGETPARLNDGLVNPFAQALRARRNGAIEPFSMN